MKEELNIAAILKDKPQGTKLYDLLYNVDVELDTISTTDTETVVWCTNETDNNTTCHRGYSEFGTIRGCPDGLQILLPSKEMRDWAKFSWEKGDVLLNDDGKFCIFESFAHSSYSTFKSKLIKHEGPFIKNDTFLADTKDWHKASDDVAKEYIAEIEEVEEQPKFKDGDIVHIPAGDITEEAIFIAKVEAKGVLHSYVYMSKDSMIPLPKSSFRVFGCLDSLRLATENEQQQLFSELEKNGMRWNQDTKQIEDLPKKCEFKTFDKVLVRDAYDNKWRIDFFSYYDGNSSYPYRCLRTSWAYCIPYNEETKHLLGTTDEWKGGY